MKRILPAVARTVAMLIALAALGKFVHLYVSVFFATYLFYIAIFTLKRERRSYDRDSAVYKLLTVVGYVLLPPGLLFDWSLNVLSSLPFGDRPRVWNELFTHRLQRYLRDESPDSYRYRAAWLLCKYLLHPWDENHCMEGL